MAMGSTTKGTQTASQDRVRQIQPNSSSGGGGTPGGGGSTPDPEASTAAPLFGQPDYAPQITFIAQASPTDNGFIALANEFHQNSGLAPKTVSSIEEIIDILNNPSLSGSGVINRMRIVSHVFFDDQNLVSPTNMMIRFLSGGTRLALKRHFNGFAGTNAEALRSMMTFEVPGSPITTTLYIHHSAVAPILSALPSSLASIISQIPTDLAGEPMGDFLDFIKLAASKWALQQGAINNVDAATAAQNGYDFLLADVIGRLRNNPLTEAQLNTLKNAIINLGSGVIASTATPNNPQNYAMNVNAALAAVQGNAFRTKLNQARQRFNRNSKIDIRGCQVGRDQEFLQAIQRFFGTNATVRPAVSGPRWFQYFNAISNITGLNNNNRVSQLYNSGFAPYTATQTRQQFGPWATAFGITDAHITFWQTTFSLSAVEFCRLQWRSNIPATPIPIARLQEITTTGFSDVFARIANVFLVTTNLPTTAQVTAIDEIQPNLNTWSTQLNATIENSATAPQLTQHFNHLKTIYEAVDRRFTGRNRPTAAQRVIPATVPTRLTAQDVRTLRDQLKTFIDTNTNSKLQPAKRFLNAVLAQVQDAPAKMRYFLGLGLPFLLYNPAATNSSHNILIAFTDTTGPAASRRQNDAIKYWIRSQWRGMIPSGLGANTTFDASRETPWLVENRQSGNALNTPPFVVSPTPEYQDKIVTEPP
jgi:hypothetical protein